MNPGALRDGEAASPDAARLIASLPQAMLLIAPDLTVAAVNPAGEQMVGQGARRLLGRPVHAIVAFDEPLIVQRLCDREAHLVARGAQVRLCDRRARPIDVMTAPVLHCAGWQMLILQEPVSAAARGIAGDGDADGAALHAPDVLAHEIKNPLAGIRGAAQLLERRVAAEDRALTALITTEVDRIARLIDQMQSLSRRSAAPARACNLHLAARRAQAVLLAARPADQAPKLVIEEQFDPSLPPVTANPDALVQVLLNLLANARDACAAQHQPRVTVRTRFASGIQVHAGHGGKPLRLPIELRISDNGPGVPPALRDHIFEPFVSGKAHGQGLGLALVQKLVRDMHGRVSHDRDESAGLTHFRLHLPVAGTTAIDAQA